MKAIGIYKSLPTDDPDCFVEREVDMPKPSGSKLLVKVKAISVNPVDYKRRLGKQDDGLFSILGWDVAGTVVKAGEDCKLFKEGDDVYYSGSVSEEGANSEFHAVEECIVGRKPESLSYAESAALPLTSITAWEGMFDRMGIPQESEKNSGKTILLIGAPGGVGSIASQLAYNAGLIVLGTASRFESEDWIRKHNVDFVLNRIKDLRKQIEELHRDFVDYIFCLNSIDDYWDQIKDIISPLGRICSIVGSKNSLDMNALWPKSAAFSWEFMSTRPNYRTKDMVYQHEILDSVADLLDSGRIKTTMNTLLKPINAENLRKAHAMLESGSTIGKVVLEGF